jgi:hypothetical protein
MFPSKDSFQYSISQKPGLEISALQKGLLLLIDPEFLQPGKSIPFHFRHKS